MSVLTTPSPTRPAYRPFATRVERIRPLSPHFVRMTFGDPSLREFGTAGLDQRVKIVVPFDDGTTSDIGVNDEATLASGAWYDRWRELPDAQRNDIRTYTVRAVRPERGEVDIDLVRHEPLPGTALGPAARWLARAAVGDEVVLVGPDATSAHAHIGIDWHPGEATHVVLVGDETAVPAACAVLEALPPSVAAHAILEVPTAADALPVAAHSGVTIEWLARDEMADAPGAAAAPVSSIPTTPQPGALLPPALEAFMAAHPDAYAASIARDAQPVAEVDIDVERIWDSPDAGAANGFYAWLAGEQSAIKRMRRHLVTELGIDRRNVAFMGYWRCGVADLG